MRSIDGPFKIILLYENLCRKIYVTESVLFLVWFKESMAQNCRIEAILGDLVKMGREQMRDAPCEYNISLLTSKEMIIEFFSSLKGDSSKRDYVVSSLCIL
jgi:hypothetical protein